MDRTYLKLSKAFNVNVVSLDDIADGPADTPSAVNCECLRRTEELLASTPGDQEFVFVHSQVPLDFLGQRQYEKCLHTHWRFARRFENTIYHYFAETRPAPDDADLARFLRVVTMKSPRYVIQCSGPDFPGILEAITSVLHEDYNITSLSLGVTPMLHSTYITCVDARRGLRNRFKNRAKLEREIDRALTDRAKAYYEAKMVEAQKQERPRVLIDSDIPKPFTLQINCRCPDSPGQIYHISQALKDGIPDDELRFFNVDEMTLIRHSYRATKQGEIDLHVSCTSTFGRSSGLANSLLQHVVRGVFRSITHLEPPRLDVKPGDLWSTLKRDRFMVRGCLNWFEPEC